MDVEFLCFAEFIIIPRAIKIGKYQFTISPLIFVFPHYHGSSEKYLLAQCVCGRT